MNLEALTNEMAKLFRSNLEEFFDNEDTSSLTRVYDKPPSSCRSNDIMENAPTIGLSVAS